MNKLRNNYPAKTKDLRILFGNRIMRVNLLSDRFSCKSIFSPSGKSRNRKNSEKVRTISGMVWKETILLGILKEIFRGSQAEGIFEVRGILEKLKADDAVRKINGNKNYSEITQSTS